MFADISGYTEFLTGTELEHSHAIVTELTKLIRASLTPPMRFVKLEGDAVFCFAPRGRSPVASCSWNSSSRATTTSPTEAERVRITDDDADFQDAEMYGLDEPDTSQAPRL